MSHGSSVLVIETIAANNWLKEMSEAVLFPGCGLPIFTRQVDKLQKKSGCAIAFIRFVAIR